MCDCCKYSSLAFLWALPTPLLFGAGGWLWSSTLVTSLCHVVVDVPDDTRGTARRGYVKAAFIALCYEVQEGPGSRRTQEGLCRPLPRVSDCVSVPVEFITLRATIVNVALGFSEPASPLVPGCPIKPRKFKALPRERDAALRGPFLLPSGM